MGIVQKVFYFHVPAAYGMYLGALFCFVGSIGYLASAPGAVGRDRAGRRRGRGDDGRDGDDLRTALGLESLGQALGVGPTAHDRALERAHLHRLRRAAGIRRRWRGERRFAAALGVLGAANLPIIHFSVQRWGGMHPRVITSGGGGLQHPDMKLALGMGFATFTLIAVAFVVMRARIHLAESRLAALEQQAIELGLGEE